VSHDTGAATRRGANGSRRFVPVDFLGRDRSVASGPIDALDENVVRRFLTV